MIESFFGPSQVIFNNGSVVTGDTLSMFSTGGSTVNITNGGPFTNAGDIDNNGGLLAIGAYGNFTNNGTFLTQNAGSISFLNEAITNGTIANTGEIEALNGGGALLFGGESWTPNGGVSSAFLGSITNNGVLETSGTNSVMWLLAPVNGTGSLDIVGGGRLALGGPVAAGETINITAGILEFGQPGSISNPAMQFLGTIDGFAAGDAMILDGVLGASAVWTPSGAGGKLDIFDASHVMVADLQLGGSYTTANFHLDATVSGGIAHTTIFADPTGGPLPPPQPPHA